ncbi:hypothetical protein [Streptacidiphilus sp. PAMC 29251]
MAINTRTRVQAVVTATVLGFAALTGVAAATAGATAHGALPQLSIVRADGGATVPASSPTPNDGGTGNG